MLTPEPTRAMVEAEAARRFGADSVHGVMLLLDRYPATGSSATPAGRARVQLAVLKLGGGRIDLVRHYVEQANLDVRDVLYWAESFDR